MKRIVAIFIMVLALVGCNEADTPDEPIAQMCAGELPDNAMLVDDYYQLSVCGWPVRMHADLYGDDKAKPVYDALRSDLNEVESVLPKPALEKIRSVKIWAELDVAEFPGGVYHPSMQYLEENEYPVKWAKGVQLGNAENYLAWRQRVQPGIVLHELAHAYDDQYFNNAQPELLAAYALAKQTGIYDAVDSVEFSEPTQAYALTDAKEYFAELTEAYFLSNDFYPFNRSQLESHDLAGFFAVRSMWLQP